MLKTYSEIGEQHQQQVLSQAFDPNLSALEVATEVLSPDSRLHMRFLKLYASLQNVRILKHEYGIVIP